MNDNNNYTLMIEILENSIKELKKNDLQFVLENQINSLIKINNNITNENIYIDFKINNILNYTSFVSLVDSLINILKDYRYNSILLNDKIVISFYKKIIKALKSEMR